MRGNVACSKQLSQTLLQASMWAVCGGAPPALAVRGLGSALDSLPSRKWAISDLSYGSTGLGRLSLDRASQQQATRAPICACRPRCARHTFIVVHLLNRMAALSNERQGVTPWYRIPSCSLDKGGWEGGSELSQKKLTWFGAFQSLAFRWGNVFCQLEDTDRNLLEDFWNGTKMLFFLVVHKPKAKALSLNQPKA